MKKYRRKGVGKAVAIKIFDMFPGGWEISQWTNNLPAQNFWSKVVAEYTNRKYDTFTAKKKMKWDLHLITLFSNFVSVISAVYNRRDICRD